MTSIKVDTSNHVEWGILVKPHGLKGEIKLKLHSPQSDLIFKINEVFVSNLILKIDYCKKVSSGILLKFTSKNNRNAIEGLIGEKIYVDKNVIPEAPSGENYYFELIGSKVVYNNAEIGTLIEIVETKANNIYVIKELDGKEILIPKTKSFIKKFNKDKKILEVILPEVI